MSHVLRWAPHVARTVFGLLFLISGVGYFGQFFAPPPPPEAALPFMTGLAAGGYFFPLLKTVELVAGLALVVNRFVPLALLLLAPILVNIAAYHLMLAPPAGLSIALIVVHLYLAWTHRSVFAPLLRARATPDKNPVITSGQLIESS